jgi:dihydrofolate reductase
MTSYIITRTQRPPNGKIHFYSGDLRDLILKLKNEQGKNIFIDGGGEIVNALLKETLIDECIISIIPILLGNGKRLFENERPEQRLTLIDTKVYDTGLVKLHYKIVK